MKHPFFFIKYFAGYIFFLFLLLVQPQAFAQKNIKPDEDSIFNKHADTNIKAYNEMRPYYIAEWKEFIPKQIKVIRKIDERLAIIAIGSKNEFDSLNQNIKISAANNSWKLSSGLEKNLQPLATPFPS